MRALPLVLLLGLFGAACGDAATSGASEPPPTGASDVLAQFSPDTRIGSGGGDPRSSEYWIMWSTCGENSQADIAERNGGRSAGWVLVDDLLRRPGVDLGGERLSSCDQVVALLNGTFGGTAESFAAQSLTAELNLAAGAELCPAAEGVIGAARAVLAAPGAGAPGIPLVPEDEVEVVRELTTLLAIYNTGGLCT